MNLSIMGIRCSLQTLFDVLKKCCQKKTLWHSFVGLVKNICLIILWGGKYIKRYNACQ